MMISIYLSISILFPLTYSVSVTEQQNAFQEKLKTLLLRISTPDDFKAMKERCSNTESKDNTSDCPLFKILAKLQEDEETTTTTESTTMTVELSKSAQSDFKVGSLFPIRTIQIPKPKIPVMSIHKPIVKHRVHISKTVLSTETPTTTVSPFTTLVEPSNAHDSPLVKLLINGQHIEHVQLEIFGLPKPGGFRIDPISKDLIENQP